MGHQHSRNAKEDLANVRSRLTKDIGAIQVSGRYHQLPRRIDQDYVLYKEDELGTGFNGAVYVATSLSSPPEEVAVKPFKLFGLNKLERRALRNEVELFLAMDHPHIARLIDVYEGATELTLVMERLTGGELFDRVQKMRVLTESDAAQTTWMMLLAINYLHSKDIVHRDIKLENFLYDSKDYRFLKLIDFGFSRFHRRSNRKMQLGCGTASYMAPEVIENCYDKRCDLWSTGVVVFILLMGYMPFEGTDSEKMEKIRKGKLRMLEAPWSRLSVEAREFVQRLLTVNPDQRMTADEALNHRWLQCREPPSAALGIASPVDGHVVESLRRFAAASKFRRACLSMMAWSLTNQQRAEVRRAFIEMDRDRKGTISLFEFKEVLQSQVSITDAEVQSIFNALTADCEDEIEYSDFLAAMVSSRIQVNDNLLRAAFRRFDVDGTGSISYNDMKQVLGECYKEEEVERLMKEVDVSGDGEIQLEEFVDYMRGDDIPDSHTEAAAEIIEAEERRRRRAWEDDEDADRSPKPKKSATAPIGMLRGSFGLGSRRLDRGKSSACCVS